MFQESLVEDGEEDLERKARKYEQHDKGTYFLFFECYRRKTTNLTNLTCPWYYLPF